MSVVPTQLADFRTTVDQAVNIFGHTGPAVIMEKNVIHIYLSSVSRACLIVKNVENSCFSRLWHTLLKFSVNEVLMNEESGSVNAILPAGHAY